MQANATIATERKTQFDTDSETIGIDNPSLGVYPTFETTLLESSDNWSSGERIRWNENDQRASWHIALELGGQIGTEHTFTIMNT